MQRERPSGRKREREDVNGRAVLFGPPVLVLALKRQRRRRGASAPKPPSEARNAAQGPRRSDGAAGVAGEGAAENNRRPIGSNRSGG